MKAPSGRCEGRRPGEFSCGFRLLVEGRQLRHTQGRRPRGSFPLPILFETCQPDADVPEPLLRCRVVRAHGGFSRPDPLEDGDHDVSVSGNDPGAKAEVTKLLKSFGWGHVIDLGDITTARGVEMVLPIWVRLMGAMQTPMFNFKIAQ